LPAIVQLHPQGAIFIKTDHSRVLLGGVIMSKPNLSANDRPIVQPAL
jgi:hypothetical protein